MKILTITDKTGLVGAELFAATYRSYGVVTVRYPVREVEATVEPYENGRGYTLRVWRVAIPRDMIADSISGKERTKTQVIGVNDLP